jgi:hypothetical protein
MISTEYFSGLSFGKLRWCGVRRLLYGEAILTLDTLPIVDLLRIASAGGGLELDVRRFTVADLARVAAAARGGGSRLVLRKVALLTVDDMIRIGSAGGGAVTFGD